MCISCFLSSCFFGNETEKQRRFLNIFFHPLFFVRSKRKMALAVALIVETLQRCYKKL